MLFLSYFRSFCTRKYNNVSCRSSLKFRSFCPLPIVRLLKVLNVACGKCGKSGKMMRGMSNMRTKKRGQGYDCTLVHA